MSYSWRNGSFSRAARDYVLAENRRTQEALLGNAQKNTADEHQPTAPQKDTTMTSIDDLFPSKYLKAGDFADGDRTLTIARVNTETMKDKSGNDEQKPVMFFTDIEKGMVLNRTNANAVAKLYGSDYTTWPGKRVTVGISEVDAFGETKEAIRIRARVANGNGQSPADKPAPAPVKSGSMDIAEAEQAWNDHPSPDTWKAFCAAIGATAPQVNAAFKGGVNTWMSVNKKTSADAARALADYIAF